ncbi:MAG: hypothetical protein IKW67_04150 [Alphaproteobacteria bacterium]|nr:hypothetical protein [Alphaproteobacteria bacterium]
MKKILSVSVIAILSITSVNAADVPVLATKNYVNQGLDTKYDADKIVVNESGVTIDGTAIATKEDISGMATDLNLANKLDKTTDLATSDSNSLNEFSLASDDKVVSEKAVAAALREKMDSTLIRSIVGEIVVPSDGYLTAESDNGMNLSGTQKVTVGLLVEDSTNLQPHNNGVVTSGWLNDNIIPDMLSSNAAAEKLVTANSVHQYVNNRLLTKLDAPKIPAECLVEGTYCTMVTVFERGIAIPQWQIIDNVYGDEE